MLKLSDNPEMLYPPAASPGELRGPWWVAHTKARCEKAFAEDLASRKIAYFLPMIERVTFSGRRKRRGMMPLFASYVFFCGNEQARQAALLTDRLARCIAIPDQRKFVEEIVDLHRSIKSGVALDPYPFAKVGRRCRVARGPLEGIEGVVVRRDDGTERFVLQVSMLGQGAAMEIDAGLLEEAE